MNKKILVLTGSPRQLGNSALLADAFIQGAKVAGHTAQVFETAFHPVLPCKACDKCWTNGKPCVFADDFSDKLAPLLEEADVLVFCTPLYWFNMSAQLKAAVDKLYSYMKPNAARKLKIKECVLLCAAEGSEPDGDFEGLKATYQSIAGYLKWTDRGMLLAGGTWDPGDVIKTGKLKEALELGKTI